MPSAIGNLKERCLFNQWFDQWQLTLHQRALIINGERVMAGDRETFYLQKKNRMLQTTCCVPKPNLSSKRKRK